MVGGQVTHELWPFLKFEVPELPPGSQIVSVVFRGTYTGVSNSLSHELCTVTSDTWQEATITWNNMPGITASIASFRETNSTLVGQTFFLDLTGAATVDDVAQLGRSMVAYLNSVVAGLHDCST